MISGNPRIIENCYSEGFYTFLSFLLRGITYWIPFSIGEILLYIIIVFGIYRLIWGIRQLAIKQLRFKSFVLKSLIGFLAWASVIYFLFMVLWGLNYHREPLVSFEVYRVKNQDFESQEIEKQDKENQDKEKQDKENKDKQKQDKEKQEK
jgi:hypothetical protein